MSLKILAVLGARSGSKGLKNKNIKILNKIPLFAHIILKAKKSKLINRMIVSTDSKNYAKIAKKYGAEVPFLRPKNFSGDKSDELDFIKHLLNYLQKEENYYPDIIVRLLATTPFQTTQDIDNSISSLMKNSNADSCSVISKANQHPEKALKIFKGNLIGYISKSPVDIGKKQTRQKFTKAFFRANIVSTRLKTIRKYDSLTGKKNLSVIIPQSRSLDIDTKFDFYLAKLILEKK